MRWSFIAHMVGVLVLFFGLTMVVPLLAGLYYRDQSVAPLLAAMAITFGAGFLCALAFRKQRSDFISQREGMAIVALGWTAVGLFGALPFWLGGEIPSFQDAFFESVSGFTTTGSSILTNIEAMSKGLLFWRSFIQWLGGMGIIVLSIAILPFLGVGGMQLYKAEVPTPVPDKLKPRIKDTAMILWKVYVLLSAAETIFLMIGGMSLFDALCHTFTTMPTGGFSTKNTSIAHFDSLYIDMVIVVFMVLAGINFSLHYKALLGKPGAFWKDSECRFYLGLTAILILIVSLNIYGSVYKSLGSLCKWGRFRWCPF